MLPRSQAHISVVGRAEELPGVPVNLIPSPARGNGNRVGKKHETIWNMPRELGHDPIHTITLSALHLNLYTDLVHAHVSLFLRAQWESNPHTCLLA